MSEPLLATLAFVAAFLVAWVLTALLVRLAPRLGLVDYPAARKVHVTPTPKGGGLAVYAAVAVVGGLATAPGLLRLTFWLLAVGACIVVLGLVDDVRPIPWPWRLGTHFLVAGAAMVSLGENWSWAWRLAGTLWVVGLVNAFNMLDNMDALSGGVAWVAALWLAAAWWIVGEPDYAVLNLTLVGALTGFLWFNLPPARIFMGDAGSTFLGYFLGLESFVLARHEAAGAWGRAVPIAILAVAWYDMISVVSIRLSQGRSPFHADKQHLSHRLVERGWRPPVAVRLIHGLGVATGLVGMLLYFVNAVGALALVGVLVVGWLSVAVAEFLLFRLKKEPSHV